MLSKKETAPPLEQQEPHGDASPEQNEALTAHSEPSAKDRTQSIAQQVPQVKRIDSLVSLRTAKGLPVKDMVEVVRTLYPKYDKVIQSKCEHGSEYGIQIRPDAFQALVQKFAPEVVRRRNHDRKRNANRIQARLTETVVRRLRQALEADGYTIQSWMEKQVYSYLEGRRGKDA